jgi:hypothetical protein
MSLSLAEYRCKLINKILFANSREEVQRYCDAAVRSLVLHKVHGFVIARFIDRMISELRKFNPMNKNARQWSNITMARILFYRIQQQNREVMK